MIKRSGSIPNNFTIGLGLETTKKGHTGLVYRYNNQNCILHLAWHHMLKNEVINANEMDYFSSELNIDETTQMFLVASASLFTSIKHAPIPYGIKLPQVVFDSVSDFKYAGGISGEGLTCATFVMKFLEAYGVILIDESSWQPRASDAGWMTMILSQLECYLLRQGHTSGHSSDLKHVEDARNFISSAVRFRPIEVFACGIQPEEAFPVDFSDIDSLVQDVIERIKAA